MNMSRFFQITYHAFVIYNSSREGINAWPGDKLYLQNIAWGGLPMVYFHHIFHPEWGDGSGWNLDLTFETPEKLTADVKKIKRITDDIARVSHLRYEFFDDYIQHGETLSQTVYSNGESIWVNCSDTEQKTLDGTPVPANDFIVKK